MKHGIWTLGLALPVFSIPPLVPGEWLEISPPGIDLKSHYGIPFVQLDPSNPSTLYVCIDMQGLWKSSNAGSSWERVGNPPVLAESGNQVHYLDSPISVAVNPADSMHLYATEGVRGNTQGFWISHTGGASWDLTPGFLNAVAITGTRDVTTFAVDPTDFKHVIVGSHSPWKGFTNAGILETKDGGNTWIIHAPIPSFNSGTMGVNFLFNPATGTGDAKTWLIGTDGQGLWRTTDAGENFSRVTPAGVWPDFSIAHGGQSLYYSKAGVVYVGGFVYPSRSTDNGLTWSSITSAGQMPYAAYYAVQGDGVNLYTMRSFADNAANYNGPFLVSAESDGLGWTPYQNGKQKFANGPYTMRFDKTNGILYAACWNGGLWALKVTGSAGIQAGPRNLRSSQGLVNSFPVWVNEDGTFFWSTAEASGNHTMSLYSMKGKRVMTLPTFAGIQKSIQIPRLKSGLYWVKIDHVRN
jgi:hypothetical protein